MKAFLLFSTWQGDKGKGRGQKGWGMGEITIILNISDKGGYYSKEMIHWGMIIVWGFRPCIRFSYLLQLSTFTQWIKTFCPRIAFLVFHGCLHNKENITWQYLWIQILIFLYIQVNISVICCTHSWDIDLNTWR